MEKTNYLSEKPTYLHLYGEILGWITPALRKKYDAAWLKAVIADGRREFIAIIPEIPYIGQKNVWKFNLILCSAYLAIIRAARKHKAANIEAVQLIYDLNETFAAKVPAGLRRWIGRQWNGPAQRKKLREGAERSQLRQYPGDWVFTYIEGDGVETPFGVDISECAILKFFRSQGEEELVPFMCKLDLFIGKALEFRFERQGTLADGNSCCDCLYYLTGETKGWNPRVRELFPQTEISEPEGLP